MQVVHDELASQRQEAEAVCLGAADTTANRLLQPRGSVTLRRPSNWTARCDWCARSFAGFFRLTMVLNGRTLMDRSSKPALLALRSIQAR